MVFNLNRRLFFLPIVLAQALKEKATNLPAGKARKYE
jgi:hypothetical protein